MKQARFLMGIDNGGSNIKSVLFDLDGNEIAAASVIPPTDQPGGGFVQRDPEAVWQCNCSVIAEVLRKSGIHPSQITAVSLCGYGGGACLLDQHGTAVYPVIVSTDTRAHSQIEAMDREGASEQIFSITHQYPWEGQPAPLLRWFREERPDILAQVRYYLSIKDYIRSRLTGVLSTELTDASNNNLIDPATRSFSDRLFVLSGLERERALFDLPLVISSQLVGYVTEQAAKETGLAPGTPVAAGIYDVSSCTLGCGALAAGSLALTNGTWSMASYLSTSYADAADSSIVTVSPIEDQFLVEQGSATGTVNLNWYLNQFVSKIYPGRTIEQIYDICTDVVQTPDPKNEIVFVPYLYASGTVPDAKGAFLNLSGHHSDRDLLYAVMEGILLSAQRHIVLLAQGKKPFREAFLSGGVSASPAWSQMFCDMLQMPVSIMKGTQQGAKGAAMCAGIAAHEFDSFEQAVKALSHPQTTLCPRKKYSDLYIGRAEKFQKALQALDLFHH